MARILSRFICLVSTAAFQPVSFFSKVFGFVITSILVISIPFVELANVINNACERYIDI